MWSTLLLLPILIFLILWIVKLRKQQTISLDNSILNKRKENEELERSVEEKREALFSLTERARIESKNLTTTYSTMEKMLSSAMEKRMDSYRDAQLQKAETAYMERKAQYDVLYNQEVNELGAKYQQIKSDISASEEELRVMRSAIEAANKDILSRRAVEEQKDFYRVCLSEEAVHDIELLTSVRPNLTRRENLDKMIYDNYVAKPTMEMIKRVLEGRAPAGIYKITRIKTGEVYIGRSTDVKSRWQQHVKTAFGCGTIAHSILHRTMEKDGIENFTFELVEECSKDKLGEREKFWIDFYGSKQYGLNEKAGG